MNDTILLHFERLLLITYRYELPREKSRHATPPLLKGSFNESELSNLQYITVNNLRTSSQPTSKMTAPILEGCRSLWTDSELRNG